MSEAKRSVRALRKTSILAMDLAKLTLFHSILFCSLGLVRSCFIKNAPRFARRSKTTDLVIDLIFWADLIMAFRCAYFDEEHDLLVTIPAEIAKNYLKGWFFIDFFSVFPIAEIVEFFLVDEGMLLADLEKDGVGGNFSEIDSGGGGRFLQSKLQSNDVSSDSSSSLSTLKLLKVVRLIRLMKLVRLLKLGTYLEKIEEYFNLNPAAFELIKLLLQVTFIAHLFGCFFFFTSQQTTEGER